MRIVVTGGTGFLGVPLVRGLAAAGHQVVVLSRDPQRARQQVAAEASVEGWSAQPEPRLAEVLSGADAVVNLAGESIGERRWSEIQKQRIRQSRLDATQAIATAIADAVDGPKVLVQQSAVGYYGDTEDREVTEEGPPGSDFLATVVRDWEAAAGPAQEAGTRVVFTRTGLVLSAQGGALERLLLPFRLGVGGPLGSGQQWFPWVHLDDVLGLFRFAVERDEVQGTINVAAPGIVTMREFARTLGRVLRRPAVLPLPGFMLRLLVGEFAETLLRGQRVAPAAAQGYGYQFRYPHLGEALRAALST